MSNEEMDSPREAITNSKCKYFGGDIPVKDYRLVFKLRVGINGHFLRVKGDKRGLECSFGWYARLGCCRNGGEWQDSGNGCAYRHGLVTQQNAVQRSMALFLVLR
jgi:hypothetical protein